MRYLRLYGSFLKFSFQRATLFRFDFYFRIVMDLIFYAVQLAFYRVLYLNVNSLGGWNESQTLVFVAGYCLVDAIAMTLFANNLWMFPALVNKGELDYYLLRPVSTFFFVTLREFAVNSFVNLLFAIGIVLWALGRLHPTVGVLQYFAFLGYLTLGTTLYLLVRLAFLLPVFWTQSGRGFDMLFWGLTRLMERPDSIFSGWFRRIFMTLLPFCLIASVPARLLFEGFHWKLFGNLLGVVLAFAGLIAFLWRRGLRAYGSASS